MALVSKLNQLQRWSLGLLVQQWKLLRPRSFRCSCFQPPVKHNRCLRHRAVLLPSGGSRRCWVSLRACPCHHGRLHRQQSHRLQVQQPLELQLEVVHL